LDWKERTYSISMDQQKKTRGFKTTLKEEEKNTLRLMDHRKEMFSPHLIRGRGESSRRQLPVRTSSQHAWLMYVHKRRNKFPVFRRNISNLLYSTIYNAMCLLDSVPCILCCVDQILRYTSFA
jgi:hypothetical protein